MSNNICPRCDKNIYKYYNQGTFTNCFKCEDCMMLNYDFFNQNCTIIYFFNSKYKVEWIGDDQIWINNKHYKFLNIKKLPKKISNIDLEKLLTLI